VVDVLNPQAPGQSQPASFTADASGNLNVTNVAAQSAYVLVPQGQVQPQ
jgi:hypothetical protein